MRSSSPAATVREAVSAPYQRRTGLPALSQISTPTTVAAGMPAKTRSAELEVAPADAAPTVSVWRAYEPPVTSVPAAASEPLAVTNATLSGAVGAVEVRPRIQSSARFSAVFERLSATRPPWVWA